jgi:hypothetical protein
MIDRGNTKADHKEHPPRPTLGLSVGITGHRELAAGSTAALELLVGELLAEIADAVHDVGRRFPTMFVDTAPDLVLLSQFARGADQLASRVGRRHGYHLRAVLPFAPQEYATDFTAGDERSEFQDLLEHSDSWWQLPNARADEELAYALAGEASIAQVDIMLAIWDGHASRGPGGTADVIDYAVRRGIPVIHIPTNPKVPPQILWSGLDGLPPTLLHRDSVPQRALEAREIDRIIANLLSPPDDSEELASIALYFGETEHRLRPRFEYPILLAAAGVRKLQKANFLSSPYLQSTRDDWKTYRAAPVIANHSAQAGLDALERTFSWADRLADLYAQTYRSGIIFNFAAGAFAVVAALISIVWPAAKIFLLGGELLLIGGVVLNTNIGNRNEWHRRWLDYRFLAEQLRPMRSLKLLGAATPLATVHPSTDGWSRWTDWYAAAMWRQMGAPPSLIDADALATAAEHIAAEEVDPQIGYHRINAKRMHHLDHKLHQTGNALFLATVVCGLVTMVGVALHLHIIIEYKVALAVLSAGLPTLGSAVFGMRGQGDFAGAARRSVETADALERASTRLRERPIELPTAARATEDAAVTMLADLGAWRSSYRDRKLAIPS